ncbi:MAG: DNA gyrase inhibitor YacG, partial [Burkholderiaceae bacterium]
MSTAKPPRRRIVTCPTCQGESVYGPENPARPFCSQRCK